MRQKGQFAMNEQVRAIVEMILKGLPNFVGLVVALYLMYLVVGGLMTQNDRLIGLVTGCAVR